MRLFRYLPGAEVSSSYRKEHDPRFDRSLTRRGTADGVSSAALPPHKHLKHEQDEQPQQAAFAAVLGLMDSLSQTVFGEALSSAHAAHSRGRNGQT